MRLPTFLRDFFRRGPAPRPSRTVVSWEPNPKVIPTTEGTTVTGWVMLDRPIGGHVVATGTLCGATLEAYSAVKGRIYTTCQLPLHEGRHSDRFVWWNDFGDWDFLEASDG